jgi:hypothetical protein
MDVGHQLEQVRFLFDQGGLEPVLKEVAAATVSTIENGAVGAQPRLDESRKRKLPGAQQEVRVVGHQGPRVKGGTRLENELGEAIEEQMSVGIGSENLPALDPTDDHVMQRTGKIEPGATRHVSKRSGRLIYMSTVH